MHQNRLVNSTQYKFYVHLKTPLFTSVKNTLFELFVNNSHWSDLRPLSKPEMGDFDLHKNSIVPVDQNLRSRPPQMVKIPLFDPPQTPPEEV